MPANQSTPRLLSTLQLPLTLLAAPGLIFPGLWSIVSVALIIAGALSRWMALGAPVRRTPLDIPLSLLAIMAVVGTAVSARPEASVSKLAGIALGLALYYALVGSDAVRQRPALLAWAIAIAGAAVAVVGLLGTDWTSARAFAVPAFDWVYERLPSLLSGVPGSGIPRSSQLFNPREIGGTLALVLPLAMIIAWVAVRPGSQAMLWAAVSLMAVVLLLTQTPTAIVGVGAALWACLIVLDKQRRAAWMAVGALALLVSILWFVTNASDLLGGMAAVGEQVEASEGHSALGIASRLELWPRAMQMIVDTPYTGIGLNTFPWVQDRFYSGFLLGAEPHAHNFLLQVAVDLGLPGLVGFFWAAITFAVVLIAGYRRSADRERRFMLLGVGASLLAFLCFGTIDAITLGAKPGVLFWAMVALGMIAAEGDERSLGLKRLHYGMAGVLVAALVLPLLWNGPVRNMGHALAYKALISSSDTPHEPLLRQAAGPLTAAVASGSDSTTAYVLTSVQARLGDQQNALAALRMAVLQDSVAPLQRYAWVETLGKQRPSPDWDGLLLTYGQWRTRYPTLAEWPVAAAIALCEGQHDREAALVALRQGIEQHAEPVGLINAYRALLSLGNC